MTWQLANEPRVEDWSLYQKWISNTTEFIKKLAPNHLVSIGNEGTITPCAKEGNKAKGPDYTTFHLWAQNWGWYDPQDPFSYYVTMKKAQEYIDDNVKIGEDNGKPVVLEEFGIARDYGSYDPNSNTIIRDLYYGFVFDYVLSLITSTRSNMVGVNFWAYGGIGRPRENGGWWQAGDQFIGDPPHERQGWYSVYNNDTTINIIKTFSEKISKIGADLPKLTLRDGKKQEIKN